MALKVVRLIGSRLLIVGPAFVLLGVVGLALFRTQPDARLGKPAPDFTLPLLAAPDEDVRISDLRGRPAVLNFWASWCEPCRAEAPLLAEVAEATPGVAFLGINILDGRDAALAYVEEFAIGYPSVRDATGRVADRFRVTGAPETVFLDARGRVVGSYIGAFRAGELEALVERLAELPDEAVLEISGRGESRPVP
jgi:cytochrome c biogenesis protein CcmG/thiol:disulfide interchange protein DsbE